MFNFNRLKYSILFLSISIAVASCSVFDPPVVVPAYGHIDSIHFTISNADTQGTASATIPVAWVYLDDNPVGAFQMPCTFPMVASNGVHSVKIYPGISAADANSAYNINPFYQYYAVSVNLQQGATTKFQPTSNYYSWVIFKLMEDFELANETSTGVPAHIIDYGGAGNSSARSDVYMKVISSPKSDVFGGNGHSGMVVVTKSKPYYIGMTDPYLSLPDNTTPVYMEANYKATTYVSVGMFEEDTIIQVSPIVASPTPTWNKLYFDMNTTINSFHLYPYYRVYFSMVLDSIDGHTSDTLLLDNIKIMY